MLAFMLTSLACPAGSVFSISEGADTSGIICCYTGYVITDSCQLSSRSLWCVDYWSLSLTRHGWILHAWEIMFQREMRAGSQLFKSTVPVTLLGCEKRALWGSEAVLPLLPLSSTSSLQLQDMPMYRFCVGPGTVPRALRTPVVAFQPHLSYFNLEENQTQSESRDGRSGCFCSMPIFFFIWTLCSL